MKSRAKRVHDTRSEGRKDEGKSFEKEKTGKTKGISKDLEAVFRALGDPVRLSVIRQLLDARGEEITCGEFKHSLTKATFSHHIKILLEAELIRKRWEGTRSFVSLHRENLERNYPELLKLLDE